MVDVGLGLRLLTPRTLSPDRSPDRVGAGMGQAPTRVGAQTRNAKELQMWEGGKVRNQQSGNVRRCGSDPTTLLTRFAEELRRVGQKYEGAKDQAEW